MSDSENWSSFENKQEKVAKQETHGEIDDRKFEARIFRNQLIFGSIVGFTSGATFATVDHFRTASSTSGLLSAKSTNTLIRSAAATSGLFAGFFCMYKGIKFGLDFARDTEDIVNVGIATGLSAAPFLKSTLLRPNMPYMMMLIALDYFHDEITQQTK